MNISFNATAMCTDGPCGYLNHIILKSTNDEITHLVIQDASDEKGHLVPIDLVSETSHDQIQLQCTSDELRSMPPFMKEEYVPRSIFRYQIRPYLVTPYAVLPGLYTPVTVENIPAGGLSVKQGARVEAADGQVGFVDEFLFDPDDNCISHLILRQGHLWGQKDVTIPMDKVERLEDNTVYLKIDKSEIESLPSVPVHRFWIKNGS